MVHTVGKRFAPTGEELINHYLKKKILGDISLINAIREVKICNYEPKFLPSLSKIRSKDPQWYFYGLKEYTSEKKSSMKRATETGFWKATGVDRKIKDKGGNGVVIGIKKTLVYHEGRVPNGVKTDWVMHEYHITSLPIDQRTYVICKVMYKGGDENILSGGNNSSGPSHSSNHLPEMCPVISPQPEVEQPIEEDELYGSPVNHLPINEHVDLSLLDILGPNTFNDNNNNNNTNPSIQLQAPYVAHEFEDGVGPSRWFNGNNTLNMQPQNPYSIQNVEENWSPWQNITRGISNTPSQVAQPIEGEALYGLSVNHSEMLMNERVDLSDPLDEQLQAPYIAHEFENGVGPSMWFNHNNILNMHPQTPYLNQGVQENWSPRHHSDTIRAVELPGEATHSRSDAFDPDMLFSDYDNYYPHM